MIPGVSATATPYTPTSSTAAVEAQETIVPPETASIANQETLTEQQYKDTKWLQLSTTDCAYHFWPDPHFKGCNR